MRKRLSKKFYIRNDVVQISKELLGKVLCTQFDGHLTSGIIVETEAYRAPDDKACHAHLNKFTERTKVMFEEGGVAYVYLCYGIHHLFNVVTGEKGNAHAILVRAIEPLDNVDLMVERRNFTKPAFQGNAGKVKSQLTAGPGVMSKALGITKKLTGVTLLKKSSPIWIEDQGIEVPEAAIIASPRVGIPYAEECIDWPWRFRVKGSKWTSKAK